VTKSNFIKVGIDATNIRGGGGVTHLVEMLSVADPSSYGINQVIVWGGSKTLLLIKDKSWLTKINPSLLNKGFFQRTFWQRYQLSKMVINEDCDILFVPGGSYLGKFHPVVTMSQNLLPFEFSEIQRFGWSFFSCKLLLLRLTQSLTFRRVDGVIFLSKYAHRTVLKVTGEVSAKTNIIPHGLSSRFYIKPRIQRLINEYSETNPFHILYVSIIDEYKHQYEVVEAISSLRKKGLPVVLDLVGPAYPPALQRLNLLINSLDAKDKWVFYHGPILFENLHHYYDGAQIGLFASSCENMPIILLEMMASGLPIACSNKGPMPEILGKAGLYFSPEDADDIRDTVFALIDSPLLRKKLAKSSYDKSKEYSWQRCAYETFSFISEIKKQYNRSDHV
jgi:glycosyltransferase involved in cell wall biosynthesis